MSISLKSNKRDMYSEIEKLRAKCEELRSQVPVTKHYAEISPKRSNLIQFCRAYCNTMGTKSVPGHIVYAWLSSEHKETV
jgi:hypothetical protein